MITLILIRGDRGVGKSTFAADLVKMQDRCLLFDEHRYGTLESDRLIATERRYYGPDRLRDREQDIFRGLTDIVLIAVGSQCAAVDEAVRKHVGARPVHRIDVLVQRP